MSKAPAFQFYAQDFLSGVMDLTMDERGLYITLLARQWTIFDEKGMRADLLEENLGFVHTMDPHHSSFFLQLL